MLKLFLYFVIAFHMAVVVLNLAIVFLIPFKEPWYVALPIETLIINLMFSPIPCPLTRLESKIRIRLGMPEVKHFVGHYIIHPIRKQLRKKYAVSESNG